MSSAAAQEVFPHIDATQQEQITPEQAQFFLDNGLLIIRNVVRGEELKRLQDETLPLIDRAAKEDSKDPYKPDFAYGVHEQTGKRVPTRIEYVIDKTPACKALLGHPFILRSVELLQGRNFVPTWDSMVFKFPGMGKSIPWHRDAGTDFCGAQPIFNVDFYLDGSDMTNCLWGVPGSNLWSEEKTRETLARLNKNGFQTEGAIPIPMNPGDVIFHNILALHGSPPAQSKLRRVIYYEFRAAEIETTVGPHTPEYVPLKQKVLLKCLQHRAEAPYIKGERPFTYSPEAKFAAPKFDAKNEQLATYRYPHAEYWRKNKKNDAFEA